MTEPVVIGDATLYLGDCRDVLPTMPKVDAVITDPPYGIGVLTRVSHPDRQLWDLERVDLRPWLGVGKYHLFWGGQFYGDQLPIKDGWLVWCKQPIGWKFAEKTYSTIELAWRDWGKGRFIAHTWDGGMRGGVAENRDFCHPSQKPVEVMTWCIEQCPEAQTILDPFMGSGTTGVAAIQLGRKFIGIEREPKYFDIACERIERAVAQGRLFEPERPKQEQETLL